ncbi:glycosyltransferase [Oscillibacter sp.]|uniref:glycosyltransferase n=2 Tax=unclassified Oscillibacter TaxID=2629304 RepID=UPI00289FF175|nr:glycosyltransferase [Oscillibacter sp.]
MSEAVLFTASTYSHLYNFHRPYLAAFRDLGWAVHIACGGKSMAISEADRVIPLPFEKRMTAPANFRAQALLRRAMEETQYSLVVAHTSLAAFFTRRAAAGLSGRRPPLVTVAHGYLFDNETAPLKREILLAAERLTAPQTDLLLTMNQWDYELARKKKLGRRVENVPGMGVDFSRLEGRETDGGLLRRELGLGPDELLAVYAAEFSARKSQSMLLRAMALLPERVKLALPGQGALLEECKALATHLGVERRIFFPGSEPDMPRWYAAADLAVSASRSEGLPFNVMEAMYAGLPVTASAVKGHTDLLAEGGGLLYPYGDAAACAAQLLRLTEDAGLRWVLGAQAREAVMPYGLDEVLPQVMEAYLSAVPGMAERKPDFAGTTRSTGR